MKLVNLMSNISLLLGSFFYPHIYDYQEQPFYLEEDVWERIQQMKAFLLAMQAGHADAQGDYLAFVSKTAVATRGYNKVGP